MMEIGFRGSRPAPAQKTTLAKAIRSVPLLLDDLVLVGVSKAADSMERGLGVRRDVLAHGVLWYGTVEVAKKIHSDPQNAAGYVQGGIIGGFAALMSSIIWANRKEKLSNSGADGPMQGKIDETSRQFRKLFLGFAVLGTLIGTGSPTDQAFMKYCAEISAVFYLMGNAGNGVIEKAGNWINYFKEKTRTFF